MNKCMCCGKLRPTDTFLAEYNPPGQFLTCRVCIAQGAVYCPIHQKAHPKTTMAPFKFKIGSECAESAPASAAPPVPSSPTNGLDTVTRAVVTLAERVKELTTLNLDILARVNSLSTGSPADYERILAENKDLREDLERARQNEETALALAAAAELEKAKAVQDLQTAEASFQAIAEVRTESIKQLQDLLADFPPLPA